MHQHHTLEEGFKYKPDYEWPEPGSEQDCPRCSESLELVVCTLSMAIFPRRSEPSRNRFQRRRINYASGISGI